MSNECAQEQEIQSTFSARPTWFVCNATLQGILAAQDEVAQRCTIDPLWVQRTEIHGELSKSLQLPNVWRGAPIQAWLDPETDP